MKYKRKSKNLRRSTCMILLFTFFTILPVDAANINKYNSIEVEISYLVEKGCDDEVVKELPEELISSLYSKAEEDFGGAVSISIEKNTKNENVPLSVNATDIKTQLQVTSYLSNFADTTGKIIWCDIYITYNWFENPEMVTKDAITINWDSRYFLLAKEGGFNASSYVKNTDTNQQSYYKFVSQPDVSNVEGVGLFVDLRNPNLPLDKQTNPGGSITVAFEPKYSFYTTDNIISNFEIMYIHSTIENSNIELLNIGEKVSANGINISTLKKNVRYRSNLISG